LQSNHPFKRTPSKTIESKYDTSNLSRLVVNLSNLFKEIESYLDSLKQEIKRYDINGKVNAVDPSSPSADREYQIIVKKAQKSFSGTVYEIHHGLEQQDRLLEMILEENDIFVVSTKNSRDSGIPIPLLEAAIRDIDKIILNLREGKSFYQKVVSELEYMNQQVGEASVRLTIERCEYEENHSSSAYRMRQEEEDARMAVSLAGGMNRIHPSQHQQSHLTPHNSGGGYSSSIPSSYQEDTRMAVSLAGGMNRIHPSQQSHLTPLNSGGGYSSSIPSSYRSHAVPPSHPGFVSVDHSAPHVRIDDEKVASLVAMDFDPEKVVAALIKFDNNVEQALNELLSSSTGQ
jgi:hypothetical protein